MTPYTFGQTIESDGKRYTVFARVTGSDTVIAVSDKDGKTLYYCTKHGEAFSPMHTNDCPKCQAAK